MRTKKEDQKGGPKMRTKKEDQKWGPKLRTKKRGPKMRTKKEDQWGPNMRNKNEGYKLGPKMRFKNEDQKWGPKMRTKMRTKYEDKKWGLIMRTEFDIINPTLFVKKLLYYKKTILPILGGSGFWNRNLLLEWRYWMKIFENSIGWLKLLVTLGYFSFPLALGLVHNRAT